MSGLGALAVVLMVLRNDEVFGCEHATRFFDDLSREISSGCRALTFGENQFFRGCGNI